MSTKRRSYSIEYKKGIVEDSRGVNDVVFCKEKMLDFRMVLKWREDYDYLYQLVVQGSAQLNQVGSRYILSWKIASGNELQEGEQ